MSAPRPPALEEGEDDAKAREEAVNSIIKKHPKFSASQIHSEVVRMGLGVSRSTVYRDLKLACVLRPGPTLHEAVAMRPPGGPRAFSSPRH
jgi:hypothetical protein